MKLTSNQLALLKATAVLFALNMEYTEIVIPQESQDWGWQFHPDYQFLVNTVEIHTTEGCHVLVVDENYTVVDSDYSVFSYDF